MHYQLDLGLQFLEDPEDPEDLVHFQQILGLLHLDVLVIPEDPADLVFL